jgi:hypothetical protein
MSKTNEKKQEVKESSNFEHSNTTTEVVPASKLEELMAVTKRIVEENDYLRKSIEEAKAGVARTPYAKRIDVHYLTLLTFDDKYLVKMEKIKPQQFNLTWEEAGMPVKITLLSSEKDGNGNYKEETIDTTQIYVQRTGMPIPCEIKKREPIEDKIDLGLSEEAVRDSETGEIKKTGNMVENILIQNIGEIFEVQLPDQRIIQVRDTVVNLKGADVNLKIK